MLLSLAGIRAALARITDVVYFGKLGNTDMADTNVLRRKYVAMVAVFVAANPGCSKWALAKHLKGDSLRDVRDFYPNVETQIKYGNITAKRVGNKFQLYLKGNTA
jgi:hypothetical protein